MEDYTFLNAHFVDNERKTVRAYWVDKNSSDIIETIIEVNEADYQWNELLEHITISQLHENTYKYIQDSQTIIKEQVMNIAKTEGWVYEVNTENSRAAVKALLTNVFGTFDEEKDKEALFFMKLEVFDLEFMRDIKDRKAKAEIRKAETPAQVLELVCKMYHASLVEESVSETD